MKAGVIEGYTIDIGPMGPIGEGEALVLRTTRNCPWNRCLYCPIYKNKTFEIRSVTEIKRDVDTVRRVEKLVEETSWKGGFGGRVTRDNIRETMLAYPEIYGSNIYSPPPESYGARKTLSNVVNWLIYGKRRLFLQDANSLIMAPGKLVEIIRYAKEIFPTVETVTSYGRSRTCARRSIEDFKKLKAAGLSWLFVGIESGCDEILRFMKKGVTSRDHIEGGKKAMDAGIDLALFVMPGLGGKNKESAEKHIAETVRVLNEIKPTEVRIRSLAVLEDSLLYEKWKSGEFEAPTEDQMIDEIRFMVENLNFHCIIETRQLTNVLFNVRGELSSKRKEILEKIDSYKAMSPIERAKFRLRKYLGTYLRLVMQWGRYNYGLDQLIEDAEESIEAGSPSAEIKAERAIFAIKSKGIP